MNRRLYKIQIRSLRTAVEHLHTLDLDGLADCAAQFGTEEERNMIQGVRECLGDLPGVPGHLP